MLFSSCGLSDSNFQQLNEPSEVFDIEKVKKKLALNESLDNEFERVLFDDYIISLSFNNNLDYHLIPFDYEARVKGAIYNFNQYLIVDNDYEIRDVRIYQKYNSERNFSFHDVSNSITSFLHNIAISKNENLTIMEFALNGDFINGFDYNKEDNIDDIWSTSNFISTDYSGGDKYDCKDGGINRYWVPYEGAPESDWAFLYSTCSIWDSGHNSKVGSPSNNNNTAPVKDISNLTCYAVKTIQEYDFMGMGFYKPKVQGAIISSKTVTVRTDGTSYENCSNSASTFIDGEDSGPIRFSNMNSTVYSPTKAWHGWSTKTLCAWVHVLGDGPRCQLNNNFSEYVEYPKESSIGMPHESCVCE